MKKLFTLLAVILVASVSYSPTPTYLNTNATLEERVNDLISKMTLEEKVSQMVFNAPAIERLGVPQYNWWNECLHGVARNGLATSFPQAIGLAATWDRKLMWQVADVISIEARAKYNIALAKGQRGRYQGLTYWSPNINIFRDPRWGRGMETYGEDPFLTGQMAVQFINGLQGDDPKYFKLIATAKHYAVHSGPEPDRHTFNTDVSEYDLRETYLPAFKLSVQEANVQSLMCAYNSVRGKACCSNDPLLKDILRNEWGFKGYIVSDCWALEDIWKNHKQVKTVEEASAVAVKAGTDLDCGVSYPALVAAVKQGLISEKEIDVCLKRLFMARFQLGMFDPADMVPYSKLGVNDVDNQPNRNVALQAARKSIVLLKNDNGTLPLKKDMKTIAVIGPNANDAPTLMSNYNGFPSSTSTPYSAIKKKVSAGTKVLYEPGCAIAEKMPLMELITAKYLFTAADQKTHGLKGEYFNKNHQEGEVVATQTDTVIDVMKYNSTENYSVRWSGVLVAPISGTYSLGCWGGNDFKLYLDDSLVAQDWNHPDVDYNYSDMQLEKGKTYRIKVEASVNTPKSPFQLIWSMPDASREQRAIEAAKKADVVVLCMGLSPRLEGEEMDVPVPGFKGGDRVSINLPATQEDLIKKIVALGKPTVLVLVNGSALGINWEKDNIPAIVESWYGGQAGGEALADVLFGDYNPSGKLPVTFYKTVEQLPAFTDYSMKGRTYRYFTGEVLFPFGYGLSYTTFELGNLTASGPISEGGIMKVIVEVKNTGNVAGEQVIQLYVKGKGTASNEAIKTLKGFGRVFLQPGQVMPVAFALSAEALKVFKNGSNFILEPGEHTLLVGTSSDDKDLKELKITVE